LDLVQKNKTIGNGKQVGPFLGPRNTVINAIKLGEEFVAVKATTTVKWLLQDRHCK
jgi:hypothetical protein